MTSFPVVDSFVKAAMAKFPQWDMILEQAAEVYKMGEDSRGTPQDNATMFVLLMCTDGSDTRAKSIDAFAEAAYEEGEELDVDAIDRGLSEFLAAYRPC